VSHKIVKCKICETTISQSRCPNFCERAIEYSLCDKHRELLTSKFLKSNLSADKFLEMIQSTDISVTPQKSPYPHDFKKDDKKDEDEHNYNDLEWELDD